MLGPQSRRLVLKRPCGDPIAEITNDAVEIRKVFRDGGSVVFAVEELGDRPFMVSGFDVSCER
jgi:hypothetical protein